MTFSRRESLGMAAAATTLFAGGATTVSAQTIPASAVRKPGVIDFHHKNDGSREFYRDTMARLNGDLQPGVEYVGWLRGIVQGVRPNEAIRNLFAFEGFSVTSMHRRPDGSWRKLLRETVMYRDLKTNEILKTWHNPYTGEEVRVVPIANDPYNATFTTGNPDVPFNLNIRPAPMGNVTIDMYVNLFYPNLLTPTAWPRESAGEFNQVTENFTYVVKKEDLENPNLTWLPYVGAWQRVTPWLPWMLMGDAPGNINYFSTFAREPGGIDALPKDLVEATRAIDPKLLRAPTLEEDTLPNESSLEAYAKEQKPAPVPAGWKAPQPPAPRKFTGPKSDLGKQAVRPKD